MSILLHDPSIDITDPRLPFPLAKIEASLGVTIKSLFSVTIRSFSCHALSESSLDECLLLYFWAQTSNFVAVIFDVFPSKID
jgi:hypothetical protein